MRFPSIILAAGALWIAAPLPIQAVPEDSQIQDELREIFQRPEFKPEKSEQEPSFLGSAFKDFLSWLGTMRGPAPVFYWLILIVLFALLLALLFYLARVIQKIAFIAKNVESGNSHVEAQRLQLSASLREEADRNATVGEYTSAVRCLFLSLVHAFDESGRLLFQPALTNREYLRGFTDRPALKDNLSFFVDILDFNWYGQRPTTLEEYRDCLGRYQRLRRQT